MLEYCAVYPYVPVGKINRIVVEQNYLSHVTHNEDGLIIPVSICCKSWIPGTVFVDEWMPQSIHGRKVDFVPLFDHLFFAYLRSDYHVDAERYILLDWDTYSHAISLKDFLGPIWDSDLGGTSLHRCDQSYSFWCGNWSACISELYYFSSLAVSIFSKECAFELAHFNADTLCEGFSSSHGSVRNPTCAKHLGFEVNGCPELDNFLEDTAYYNSSDTPCILHSIRFEIG